MNTIEKNNIVGVIEDHITFPLKPVTHNNVTYCI